MGLEQDHCPVLVLPRSPQPVVQVQSLKSFSRALARSSRGSCGHTRVQGLCLAAGPRVPLGLAERTWHIRACTRGVHGHVHSAGYTRAGSRRFGGQEPGRLGAPGAALGEQEQRTRRGRGWPGPAVIGCWGARGKPGREVGGRGLRGAPRGRNPGRKRGPGTRPHPAICAAGGRAQARVGFLPSLPGWPQSCAPSSTPTAPPAQLCAGSPGPGQEGLGHHPAGTPPQEQGSGCRRARGPEWNGARDQEAAPSGSLAGASWLDWERGRRTGDTQREWLGEKTSGGGHGAEGWLRGGVSGCPEAGHPSLTAWGGSEADGGARRPDRVSGSAWGTRGS